MRIPRWEPGRQGGGYRKMRLASGGRWDLHLIDYPRGVGIPVHSDPIPGRRHLRVNLTLRRGGSSAWYMSPLLLRGRLAAFWSDRPHGVDPGAGRRTVLSLGVAV